MTSNLGCIGLDAPDSAVLERLLRTAAERGAELGVRDGRRVVRWQDDEGARLVLVLDRSNRLVAVTPSFASEPGAVLGSVQHANDECWTAAVMEDGSQVTALAADLEQWALLDPGASVAGDAGVVALGRAVEVLPDAATFAASSASLLDPSRGDADGGHRMGPESFIPTGMFADGPSQVRPHGRLNGTVLRSRTCRNSLTGTEFHVARVRTIGFEVDVCLAASEHPEPPSPGAVVAGMVYLVAALDGPSDPEPTAPRRRIRAPWRR
ncbi:hypothetical protein [Cellulomonas fimi]|uniref:Uncharacterized protein n=1 Tax=Cellulomonas fimi (strain ATCC 484 / DSM 20113 / JCM 1341 / CCUG 24087 / LMG 16345 / NBRC 15513 / NCIMB 8980 / NCTC 7547 / NRS-133) TaxID=590998 RepID=F4H2B8_CELFA|nr:hypothetical protein [Cellulomonas fimi]AEE47538.1 hypothetical protein Celf_3426 [Cellulomonas fimi ATCC 484]NNH07953.1 hypothetical protein [Cellulomonas fimi]VEH36491.1 Uncharacterised protein [Cellulomonas fimi]